MATKTAAASSEIFIQPTQMTELSICIKGETPLIMNRMSEKVRQELILPKGRKTAADKASTMKHNPIEEYRASPYMMDVGPTAIGLMATSFKRAMGTAALDLPGAKKSQIGRLVFIPDHLISVYGVPRIFCAVTRSADMARTPDVRTRLIVPQWAAILRLRFVSPILNETAIFNLLNAAGMTCGVGDWRQEKGSGSFGAFSLCSYDDTAFQEILSHGRDEQEAALKEPAPYDDETAELLQWFGVESARRGFKIAA